MQKRGLRSSRDSGRLIRDVRNADRCTSTSCAAEKRTDAHAVSRAAIRWISRYTGNRIIHIVAVVVGADYPAIIQQRRGRAFVARIEAPVAGYAAIEVLLIENRRLLT